jgi:DNA (cytosine-5)-methyltransferase 1
MPAAEPASSTKQGTRSGLWLTIAEGIRLLRPQVVVVENVAALRRRGLDRVLGDLAGLGYDAPWTSLEAADVGAPHHRQRVFLLGHRPDAASLLQAAADADRERQPRHTAVDRQVAPDDATRRGRQPVSIARQGIWGVYEPAIRRWEAVTGRPAPRPTELGTRGQPRLAPAFSEWLMGLPAGFVTDLDLPYYAKLKALGNGVVPQQAEAALRHLVTIAAGTLTT